MKCRAVVAIYLAIFLSGCSDALVDEVQSAQSRNSDYTYGQFLNNRPHCVDVEWASEADSRGRDVVLYSCQHAKIGGSQLQDKLQERIGSVQDQSDILVRYLESTGSKLEEDMAELESPKTSYVDSLEEKLISAQKNLSIAENRLADEEKESPDSYVRSFYEKRGKPDHEPTAMELEHYGKRLDRNLKDLRDGVESAKRIVARREADLEGAKERAHHDWKMEVQETEKKLKEFRSIYDKYNESVNRLREESVSVLQEAYNKDYFPVEQIRFLVTESEIKMEEYKLLLNGSPVNASYGDGQRLGFEMARPELADSADFQSQWMASWTAKIHSAVGDLPIESFPYRCDSYEGICAAK